MRRFTWPRRSSPKLLQWNKRASGEVTCRVLVCILLRSDARKYILYYFNSDRVGGKERYLKRGSSGSRTSVLGWDLGVVVRGVMNSGNGS